MNNALDLAAIAKELGGEWFSLSEGEPEQDTRSEEERREMDEDFEAAFAAADEPEYSICGSCRGSGEGYHDGSTCSACGGSGVPRCSDYDYAY